MLLYDRVAGVHSELASNQITGEDTTAGATLPVALPQNPHQPSLQFQVASSHLFINYYTVGSGSSCTFETSQTLKPSRTLYVSRSFIFVPYRTSAFSVTKLVIESRSYRKSQKPDDMAKHSSSGNETIRKICLAKDHFVCGGST